MQSVAKLVAFLMQTYHIPADHVLGHGEAKPTDCPGRFMSVAEVVKMAGYIVAKQDADKDSATARLAAAKTFSDVSAIQTK
jgi:N-acetyl-anhydromuramyl-L-alanine amidase AmpD